MPPTHTHIQTHTHPISLTTARPLAEHPGNDGNSDGGGQSGAARRRHPGQPGGGAELPAALEGPQRLRPAERHRPTGLPTTGSSHFLLKLCFKYMNQFVFYCHIK